MSRRVVLAVDGGNSKTTSRSSRDEASCSRSSRPQSSPHQLGLERRAGLLEQLLERGRGATSTAQPSVAPSCSSPASTSRARSGSSGGGRGAGLGGRVTVVGNDTFAVLRAGTERGWGVAVVCGAGINCVGVAAGRGARALPGARRDHRRLGRRLRRRPRGVAAAARSEDGRGPKTTLERAVPAHFGFATPLELAEAIHRGWIPAGRVGELAPLVLAEARARRGRGRDRRASGARGRRLRARRARAARAPARARGRRARRRVLQAATAGSSTAIADGLRAVGAARVGAASSSPPIVGAALLGLDEIGAGRMRGAARGELDEAAAFGEPGRRAMADVRFEEATGSTPAATWRRSTAST